jgi:hypothetical protein
MRGLGGNQVSEWDFEAAVARVLDRATHSNKPFFFPSPLECHVPTFLEPLARLKSHLRDVEQLIPEAMNESPSLRETFGGLVEDFCSDYPEVSVDSAWRAIVLGHAMMMENFTAKDLPKINDIRINPFGENQDSKEISITYSQTYETLYTGPEMGRSFYYAFRSSVPDNISDVAMFMNLWSRLSAVPSSGSAQGRSALLLLAAFFEEYLMKTMEVALVNGTAFATGLTEDDFRNWARFGFQDYIERFNALVGGNILEPMVEPMARRNAFIHRGGLADAKYVERYPHLGLRDGEPIRLDVEYLRSTKEIARLTAEALTQSLAGGRGW